MTLLERSVAALAEVNPAVAAALEAAGSNTAGHPLVGFLGWLPPADLLDLARACFLASGDERYGCRPEELAQYLPDGIWRSCRGATDVERVDAAVRAWALAHDDGGEGLAELALANVHLQQECPS